MDNQIAQPAFDGAGATQQPPWDDAAAMPSLAEIDSRIAGLYQQGLKGRAIAQQVGLPESTVGNRLFALRRDGVIGRRNRCVTRASKPAPRKLPSVQIRDDVAKMQQAAARLQGKRETLAQEHAQTIALYMAGCGYLRLETLLNIDANAALYRLRVLKAAGLIPYELPKFNAEAVAEIMGLPAKVKPTAAAAEFVCASPNAWPNGPREMPCMTCSRPFLSMAKDNRRCNYCRGLDDGPSMAPALSLRSVNGSRVA